MSSVTYVDSILLRPRDPELQRRLGSREMGRSCQRICGCLSKEINSIIIKIFLRGCTHMIENH